MNENTSISLVTTCKGRLAYLKKSLQTWLNIDYKNFDIIIVDYDCPDGTEEYIKKNKKKFLNNSNVTDLHVVKVNNKPLFNLCDARNNGIDFSNSELIFMIDADIHIRDNNILNYVSEQYKKGIVFFSNVAVLSTNFEEGHVFYKVKYGIEKINYYSLLPTHCIDVGLSGTSCFKKSIYLDCGKYNVEMNEQGWGSDDIEFYIRYLNYVYYSFVKEKQVVISDPMNNIDSILKRIDCFAAYSFELVENTEEEKTRFYDKSKHISSQINKNFIKLLMESEGEKLGWVKKNSDFNEVSVLKYRRYKKYPIPTWFLSYYYYYVGFCFFNTGRWNGCIKYLKNFLTFNEIEPNMRWEAYYMLGLAHKKLDINNRYYLKMAYKFADRSNKNIDICAYNRAFILNLLGDTNEAEICFKNLLTHILNNQLKSRIYFHLGEINLKKKEYIEARKMFKETLVLNPGHQKANKYLEMKKKE